MRCWRWHERPRIATLCAAFAAAVISAGAAGRAGYPLPAAAVLRAPLAFSHRMHDVRLERFGAHGPTPHLRGVHDAPALNLTACLLRFNLLPALKRTQAHDSLVAYLLTL